MQGLIEDRHGAYPIEETAMQIVNLTPHPVHIVGADGKVAKTFPVAGPPARCREVRKPDGVAHVGELEIPLTRKGFGEIEGLPESREDTIYVVSLLVASAASKAGRVDVVYPDDVVRDADGTIIGCRAFARSSP